MSPFRPLCLVLTVSVVLASGCGPSALRDIQTDTLLLRVDRDGRVSALRDLASGRDLQPPGMRSPLLQVMVADSVMAPVAARTGDEPDEVVVTFPGGSEVAVRLAETATHLRLEIVDVSGPARVDLAVWGPYATVLDDSIGETVGIASGDGFTVGLQALNARTLGGYPWKDNDAMPQLDIFEGDPTDLSEAGKRYVLYRVEAAKPDTFGSTLQAYVRDRGTARVVENWGHPAFAVPPFDDGGIAGSAIALFGVPSDRTLETIGAIEVAEGLPHPTLDGVWTKEHPGASGAYVILPFGEDTIDRALDVVERAGLGTLYHPDPFSTWGHFALRPDHFPTGVEGLRAVVDRAAARGIRVGVHTLSNFITSDDPYVTPVPDPRLAEVGSTVLAGGIEVDDEEVPVESPDLFVDGINTTLRAVRIGDEILQYRAVSETAPWRLLDVQRGAFGTSAAAHEAGSSVALLADHAYRVFLGDAALNIEIAGRLADLFNHTGLRQISFDGLEGNRSSGMGNYGEILFTKAWFDGLSDDIRSGYIADASRTSHYFWHIYTRMNWGEPWYAGFRESQTEYRMKNQAYFRRNLMPGMLGWFSMRPGTSREDIEWMLARSAAFDAGYAFYTSFEALEANGLSDEILGLLGRWEAARMAGAFSADQKRRMEDVSSEFRLEAAGESAWTLVPVSVHRLEHRDVERQPGEPDGTTLVFDNPGPEQPMAFILSAAGGAVFAIELTLDGQRVPLVARLADGHHIVYRGGATADVVGPTWQRLRSIPVDPALRAIAPGAHQVRFSARIEGDPDARAKLEIRLDGLPETATPRDQDATGAGG